MKITVLKNDSGMLSGVVIPAEELNELKRSLKDDSEFFKTLEAILTGQKNSPDKSEISLSSGLTLSQFESKTREITRKLYSDAFQKGLPMYYKDGRTKDASHFVRANPDGSEDLVSFNPAKREYAFIQQLASAGKGYWSDLISA
ncbi:hypothetical protein KK062_29480 [Fulvivirgaceae bacterium PWU5]|uniref:Uncharacterized protein n=1 Tax=Dawidia cretensis TaxID=2782350 RepID=A0AAP2GWH9_9BACT|nr:hypothetical protein [Dawidia cretensis]MBT1712410.1 hypothetical protein [Dawidia cretensis]